MDNWSQLMGFWWVMIRQVSNCREGAASSVSETHDDRELSKGLICRVLMLTGELWEIVPQEERAGV
jgi:hypothetical protein